MTHGILYLGLSGVLAWLATRSARPGLDIVLWSAAFGFLLLSVAYFRRLPGMLGKRRDGRMLFTSYLLFWPHHLQIWLSMLLARMILREPLYTEIVPGLYLGGRPLPWEQTKLRHLNLKSVLDCTAEFPESNLLRELPGYQCSPTLDNSAPGPEQLAAGADFIARRLKKGPVYVHCALGHGRAPTYVMAYLLRQGISSDANSAVTYVRSKRKNVRLLPWQRESLQHITQHE